MSSLNGAFAFQIDLILAKRAKRHIELGDLFWNKGGLDSFIILATEIEQHQVH